LDAMLAQVEAGASPEWAQPTQTAHAAQLPPPPPRPDGHGPGVPPMPRALSETQPHHQGRAEPRNRMAVIIAVIALAVAVVAATALVFVLRSPDGKGKEADRNGDKDNAACPGGPDCTTSPPQDPPTTLPPTTPPTTTPAESSPPPVDEVANTWVAQLASFPKSSGTGPRDRAAAALRARGAENVQHLDSSAYASLKPGYWVLYSPGFGNGEEAVSYCQGIGLTSRNQCVGRFISKSGTDFKYQCFPAAAGGTTGRCTRP
ncbi:serine/threonine protein kinase, partial [Streptomyces sp. T-3]|nr:serine/threonine protein kinase [Streptomyces sp. T-3]